MGTRRTRNSRANDKVKNGTWISLSDYKAPLRRPQHMTTTPPLCNKEVLMLRQRKDGVNAVGDVCRSVYVCMGTMGVPKDLIIDRRYRRSSGPVVPI